MKIAPTDVGFTFKLAVAASLVAGAMLMFGSLQYAATHMQVTM